MNKNQKLIKSAIASLQKVDKRTIRYQNSFLHVIGELISFYNDCEKNNAKRIGVVSFKGGKLWKHNTNANENKFDGVFRINTKKKKLIKFLESHSHPHLKTKK